MEKTEFLEQHIFTNLKNLNKEFKSDSLFYFSEADFKTVLERIENLGIGVYEIKPRLEGELLVAKINEDYRKKATNPKWYKKAFSEFKKQQADLEYSATYRVSERLLNRENSTEDTN